MKYIMLVSLDEGAKLPERAHEADAGLDLFSRESVTIFPGGSHTFDTGVHVDIPKGFAGLITSKSGLNVNHGLISDGTIDAGYSGSIRVKLYNIGERPYNVEVGDKISQLIIIPVILTELVKVDKFDGGDRGDNGFGSTGR